MAWPTNAHRGREVLRSGAVTLETRMLERGAQPVPRSQLPYRCCVPHNLATFSVNGDALHGGSASVAKASRSCVPRCDCPVRFPEDAADVFAAVLVDVAGI